MDEILARLQETSQNCLKAYADWVEKKRDPKAQEMLQAAIHELRKVASRLEIDLAVSERDQMTARHLPIPSHRSVKGEAPMGDDEDDFDDSMQNFVENNAPKPPQQQRRRMPQHRKPMQGQQGGGQGQPQ
jgi:hypothetical protein